MRSSLLLLAAALLASCGGDDDPFANADPRCAALCMDEPPSLDGAFDVCDVASARSCLDQCAARIADVSSLCASCVLEDADFDTDQGPFSAPFCDAGTCELTGRAGTCMYPEGNQAAEDDCWRQVYPRREVACQPEFRPIAECASTCG